MKTLSNLSSCNLHKFLSSQLMPILMIDEGSAYRTVVTYFGWNHVLDRYHFNEQISGGWEGLKNSAKFRQNIIHILISCTERQYTERMSEAKKTTQLERPKIFFYQDVRLQACLCFHVRRLTFPLVERKI